MIYVTNEDKPGFIGRFASALGDAGINIATFALGRDAQGGSAIALVEVDGDVPAPVLDTIQSIPGVKQAKPLFASERHVLLNDNRPGVRERSGANFRRLGQCASRVDV